MRAAPRTIPLQRLARTGSPLARRTSSQSRSSARPDAPPSCAAAPASAAASTITSGELCIHILPAMRTLHYTT